MVPGCEVQPEMMTASKTLASGTKVRVATPGGVPEWSEWDDDHGRASGLVKKRLQSQFFKGDKKLNAEIIYIAKESEREKLRRKGQCKVRIRDQSGCTLVITADPNNLTKS
jgi:hypothetical protein